LPTSPGHRDRTDSPEVSPPFSVSTRGAPGHSDLAALVPWTRLPPPSGSAFRFFQPLDGLRRPRASRPYFVPLTLWDLLFRAFPCQKAAPLSRPLLPCGRAVTDLRPSSDPAASRPSLHRPVPAAPRRPSRERRFVTTCPCRLHLEPVRGSTGLPPDPPLRRSSTPTPDVRPASLIRT